MKIRKATNDRIRLNSFTSSFIFKFILLVNGFVLFCFLIFLLFIAVSGPDFSGKSIFTPTSILSLALCLLVLLSVSSLIVFFFLKKTALDPLNGIYSMLNRLRNENFNEMIKYDSPDEFGVITNQMNKFSSILENKFARLALRVHKDILTGLPNRHQIMLDINIADSPTLVLMNIDQFKEFNDCYGNWAGDMLLKEIAARLGKFGDEYKYNLYRMPADEFALLFDGELNKHELIRIIRHLSGQINDVPYKIKDELIHARITCGAARWDDITVTDHQAMKKWHNIAINADMALKRAKRLLQGFLIYNDSMEIKTEFKNNLFWKKSVTDAFLNQRIIPFYQPIVDNATRNIEKYECLVRLIDRNGKIIEPLFFLESAKKAHVYKDLTKTMLDYSIAEFEHNHYEFSINLTINDILNEDINLYINSLLQKYPHVAERIVFEILESEGIENLSNVQDFIREVKAYNCKIAIDDFGSGYSNFDHIFELAVDYIKIDSSLIKNLDVNKNAQIITKTIVSFAKELGIKTIAEYVHSFDVYAMGLNLGVDFSQGYYFGEPKQTLVAVH